MGNIFFKEESLIQLAVRNEIVKIRFLNNKIVDVTNPIRFGTETIYMDDPFVVDELSGYTLQSWPRMQTYPDHRSH